MFYLNYFIIAISISALITQKNPFKNKINLSTNEDNFGILSTNFPSSPINEKWKKWSACGDGICNKERGEDCYNCIFDCGVSRENQEKKIFRTCLDKNKFALTFDDGPNKLVTLPLLKLLEEKNVKATFFMIAEKLLDNENLIIAKEVISKGHQIANHSYNHPYFTKEYSKVKGCKNIIYQLKTANDIFKNLLNVSPKYFRFPYGDANEDVVNIINNWGYKIIFWNLDTNDWYWMEQNVDSSQVVESYKHSLINNIVFDKFISLQHDSSKKNPQEFIEAISIIIDLIKSKGYEFVTMAECLNDYYGYFEKNPNFTKCDTR